MLEMVEEFDERLINVGNEVYMLEMVKYSRNG